MTTGKRFAGPAPYSPFPTFASVPGVATSAPALRWDYWMLLGRDVPSSSTRG